MMRALPLLAALLLFAIPVHAQLGEKYEACVGEAEDNVTITDCMYEESERLDKDLERAYLDSMTRALDQEQLEKDMPSGDAKDFTNVVFLQKGQDAFKAYMENECDRRRALFGNGSGAGLEHVGCLVQLKTQRIKELKNS